VSISIRDDFFSYFGTHGYRETPAFRLDESNVREAFTRSLDMSLSYKFLREEKLVFDNRQLAFCQPVVRPEDFLPLETDLRKANPSKCAKALYRSGVFDLLVLWHAGPAVFPDDLKGHSWLSGCSRPSYYGLISLVLTFLFDVLKFEREKLCFSLWPGGDVVDGEVHIPAEDEARSFLREVWSFDEQQIIWDEANVWPERAAIEDGFDSHRSGLVAPVMEIYYHVGNQVVISYPGDPSEYAEKGFMELVSAISISRYYTPNPATWTEVVPEKMVAGVGFGLQRAAVCVEQVANLYDTSVFKKLRGTIEAWIDKELHVKPFCVEPSGTYLFAKMYGRIVLLLLTSAQGIGFDRTSRGRTLRKNTIELFKLLQTLGLDNQQITSLIELVRSHLVSSYSELRPESIEIRNFMHQQFNPTYVLRTEYVPSQNGGVEERRTGGHSNSEDPADRKQIPELDNLT